MKLYPLWFSHLSLLGTINKESLILLTYSVSDVIHCFFIWNRKTKNIFLVVSFSPTDQLFEHLQHIIIMNGNFQHSTHLLMKFQPLTWLKLLNLFRIPTLLMDGGLITLQVFSEKLDTLYSASLHVLVILDNLKGSSWNL